jgi:uncharacterized phage-associated protein
MFPEVFHAWKYGPVIPQIRQLYKDDLLHESMTDEEARKYHPIIDEVFRRLAGSSSLTLVAISHSELSWKRARAGFGKWDSSDVPMKLDDIKEDAINYRIRQFMLKKLNEKNHLHLS